MTTSLKRFGGVLSIVALLVVFAWTPGEAGWRSSADGLYTHERVG